MDAAEVSWMGLLGHAEQLGPDPELGGWTDERLEQEVRDGASRIAALTCQWLVAVAEFVVRGRWGEQGARTPAVWLSWACGVSPSAARDHVRVGLALRSLPVIRARFAAGTISYAKVRAITRVATPEVEAELVRFADAAPASELERIIALSRRQLRAGEQWTGAVVDEVDGTGEWDVGRRQVGHDTVEFRVRMPLADAEAFEQRMDRLVEVADDIRDAEGVRLSIGTRRARALCDAMATAVAAGPRDASDVARAPRRVLVHGRRRSMMLPRSVLARLTCTGDLRMARRDHGGHPHDLGRTSREPSAALRRAVLLRDRHCRFPRCHATRGLHAHHVLHWGAGGPTDLDNLVMLCGHHHRFVHDHKWRMAPLDPAAGRWKFHPPGSGRALRAVEPLPGASAEAAAAGLAHPPDKALQPPWWDGWYDLDLTIELLTDHLAHNGSPPGLPVAA